MASSSDEFLNSWERKIVREAFKSHKPFGNERVLTERYLVITTVLRKRDVRKYCDICYRWIFTINEPLLSAFGADRQRAFKIREGFVRFRDGSFISQRENIPSKLLGDANLRGSARSIKVLYFTKNAPKHMQSYHL